MGFWGNVKQTLKDAQPLISWTEPAKMELVPGSAKRRLVIAWSVGAVIGGCGAVFVLVAGGPGSLLFLAALGGAFVALTILGFTGRRPHHVNLSRDSLSGWYLGHTGQFIEISSFNYRFQELKRVSLEPHWRLQKEFSLLCVQAGRKEFALGIPKGVDLKRITAILAAGGAPFESDEPHIALLIQQTRAAAQQPSWSLAQWGVDGNADHANLAWNKKLPAWTAALVLLLGIGLLASPFAYILLKDKLKDARNRAAAAERDAETERRMQAHEAESRAALEKMLSDNNRIEQSLIFRDGQSSPITSWKVPETLFQFPSALALNSDGSQLFVASSKGIGEIPREGTQVAATCQVFGPAQASLFACTPQAGRGLCAERDQIQAFDTQAMQPLTLFKAGSPVEAVALSFEGKLAAYVTLDGVWLWDQTTSRATQLVKDTMSDAHLAAFSADNRQLVVCDRQKILVIPIDQPSQTRSIALSPFATTAAVSPDARYAAVANSTNLDIWNLATGQKHATATIPLVRAVVVAGHGPRLYVASSQEVVACDLLGRELFRLRGHTAMVRSLALSADEKRLASLAEMPRVIRVWDLPTGEMTPSSTPANPHSTAPPTIASNLPRPTASTTNPPSTTTRPPSTATNLPSPTTTPTTSPSGTASPTSPTTPVNPPAAQPEEPFQLTVDPNAVLVQGGETRPIKSWQMPKSLTTSLAKPVLSNDGNWAIVDQTKAVHLWPIGGTEPAIVKAKRTVSNYSGWHLAQEGKRLLALSSGVLEVRDAQTLEEVGRREDRQADTQHCAISADGSKVAYFALNKIVAWDVATGNAVPLQLPGVVGIEGLQFTADGQRLLVVTLQMILAVDLARPQSTQSIPFKGIGIHDVGFSADGLRMAYHEQGFVRLLDLSQKSVLANCPGPVLNGGVLLTPDGQRLYYGLEKDVVACTAAGQELYRLRGHTLNIMRLSLSGDGKRLLSADLFSSRVWELPQ